MSRWSDRDDVPRGEQYDARWEKLAAAGGSIHGEADLVTALLAGPADVSAGSGSAASVLDAGCGTGRVSIELAKRGFDVVGVDLDAAMLDTARSKAPDLEWIRADLVDMDLGRTFDLVVLAGNVMIFVTPGTEAAVLANLARHLRPGGQLVAGFQTGGTRLDPDEYDAFAAACGLEPVHRWATWERDPHEGGDYAVSVHRRP